MPKIPFTFRFDETYYAKLKIISVMQNRSMSNLIEYLCKQEIERVEGTFGKIELDEEDIGLK